MRIVKNSIKVLVLVFMLAVGIPGVVVMAANNDYSEVVQLPLDTDTYYVDHGIMLIGSEDATTFRIDGAKAVTKGYLTKEGEYNVTCYQGSQVVNKTCITIDYQAPKFTNVVNGARIPVGYNVTFQDNVGIESLYCYNQELQTNKNIAKVTSWTPESAGEYSLCVRDYAGNIASVTLLVGETQKNLSITGVNNLSVYKEKVTVNVKVEKGAIYYALNDNAADNYVTATGQTISLPFTQDGYYDLFIKDDYGNSRYVSFIVDLGKPVISVLNQDGSTTPIKEDTIYINKETAFLAYDPFMISYLMEFDNEFFESYGGTPMVISEDGHYKLFACDMLFKSKHLNVYYDSVAPKTTLVNNRVYTNSVTATADDDSKVTCYIDGVAKPLGTVIEKDGYHNITFIDQAKNRTSLRIKVVDKKSPVVSGVKNNNTYKSSVTIKFFDGSGIKSAKFNGKTIKSGLKVTKAGTYKLDLYDTLGNRTKLTFRIDLKAPTVKGVSHNKAYKSTVRVYYSDDLGIKSATINGKKYKSGTKLTKSGKKTLVLTDVAGRKITKVFYIDKSAPKVSGVKNKAVYRKAVKVKFADDTGITSITLNKKKFKNGSTIKAKGKYTLVAIDKAGRKITVSFTIK